ncbi:MAG: hypothetical protein JJU37_12565 [Balneolaceae bacterium]|nr:hypothetical protein [Balneolaceae bacterium]
MIDFLTFRVGRLLFALPFGIFGIIHFMMGREMAGMVPDFVPGGIVWVYLIGIALLGACFSFVAQVRVKEVALLLALLLLIFVGLVHVPGVMAETPNALFNLLKDTSLAGGALFLAGLYSEEDEDENDYDEFT